jgi:hypothetical protein
MKNSSDEPVTGIDLILEFLTHHYEMDARGRLQGVRRGGGLPRFVFARSAEGCLWRYRMDIDAGTVVRIARLAGRERGWPVFEGEAPPPPERLEMIARMLGEGGVAAPASREVIRRSGTLWAEVWVFE